MWPYIVQYLHFRILKFPLTRWAPSSPFCAMPGNSQHRLCRGISARSPPPEKRQGTVFHFRKFPMPTIPGTKNSSHSVKYTNSKPQFYRFLKKKTWFIIGFPHTSHQFTMAGPPRYSCKRWSWAPGSSGYGILFVNSLSGYGTGLL